VTGQELEPVYDGEVVPGIKLTGKIAVAYARVAGVESADPDDRPDPGVAELDGWALSEATKRAYRRWINMYLYYCGQMGRREVPAAARTLEGFMTWLAAIPPTRGRNAGNPLGMSPASLRQALSAVHALHDAAGQPWASTGLANKKILGHANKRADAGMGDDRQVPPIKLPTLLQLIRACPAELNVGIRDRSMLSLGFAMMARRSELVSLDLSHITEASRGGYRIHVPRTKTDRRKGRVCYIPRFPDHPDVCPVVSLEAWADRRQTLGITDGPFFRAIDRWDHVLGADGHPYAGKSDTMRMDPADLERIIARAAGRALTAGERIANAHLLRPHSLRAGGVTSAYEAGADILSIARQGGWGDRSPVIFRYIREVEMELRNPMAKLFGLAA
jgi:integrase